MYLKIQSNMGIKGKYGVADKTQKNSKCWLVLIWLLMRLVMSGDHHGAYIILVYFLSPYKFYTIS